MMLVIMHMKVAAKKRKELTQTISSLLGAIRAEKGCGRCDLFCGLEDENSLCLLEEWDTREDFAAHCLSDPFKVLRGGMNLLDEPCSILSCRTLSLTESEDAGHRL
jgi:quinol monooxygenase YgiN